MGSPLSSDALTLCDALFLHLSRGADLGRVGFVLVLNAWGLKSKKKPKTWFFCKKKIRGDFERYK
jgi:hypothetical protein